MADRKADAYEDAVMSRMGSTRFGRRRSTEGEQDDPAIKEMRLNRRARNSKTAASAPVGATSYSGGGGGDISFATGRPRDPMFYWRQNNLPYDVTKADELRKIRAYCRLLYMSHPIIASCVDIYSKYPLVGMELVCKDEQIKEFYETLFFDEEGLDYAEFLIDIGREYWTTGEAWAFGSFNETLGVWEDDELLNPDDVEVMRDPFMKEPRYLIKLPETLRKIITEMQPRWQYERLMTAYPELKAYASQDALMPVSNILLRQMRFKGDTFNPRGIPILMRAMRAVMQEEMLNSAMDAIADRLYTPLILVKLGASATDLGTQIPWIPTEDERADFEESLDGALAADFRVLVHHFGVTMEPVFGREAMPNLDPDFDRLEERMLQTFGLSKTMLSGGDAGETYAADALNRDLISQLLTTYQRLVKGHYRQRALVVAEAQGHYDYEVRNGKRYVKMEEILEVDEETGEERIVEQPKLLIPDLVMKTMNVSDEQAERQFIEGLVAAGVPISMRTRLANTGIDLDDEREATTKEKVDLAVSEQEVRREQFKALRAAGLPIPEDLRNDFEPKVQQANGAPAGEARTPLLGTDETVATPNLAPTQDDLMGVPADDGQGAGADPVGGAQVLPFPPQQAQAAVPPESHEMAASMPKAGAKEEEEGVVRMTRISRRIKAATDEHFREFDHGQEPTEEVDGHRVVAKEALEGRRPHGRFGRPRHVGMRRFAVTEEMARQPMDEWEDTA